MNPKKNERSRRTEMRQERSVSSQALSGFFVWSKSLILKEVVGAKGFEPSTSWSRTSGNNHRSRCPGVTYRFSGRSLMDKSGQVVTGWWREFWGNGFETGLT